MNRSRCLPAGLLLGFFVLVASGLTAATQAPLTMQHQVERQWVYPGESLLYELVIRYQGYPRNPRLSPLEITGGYARRFGQGREEGFQQQGTAWQEARWQAIISVNKEEPRIAPRYFSSFLEQPGRHASERYAAQVDAIALSLRPLPEHWPEEALWLPAKGMELTARWKNPPPSSASRAALVLEIHLTAVGQQAQKLPLFAPLGHGSLRMEALSEERWNRVVRGQLVGQLKQRLLVYPPALDSLQLPELQVPWWNLVEERLEYASVTVPEVPGMPEVQKTALSGEVQRPASEEVKETPPPPWGILVLSLFLLLSLLGSGEWLRRRYQRKPGNRLKKMLRQGPKKWSHAALLALLEDYLAECPESEQRSGFQERLFQERLEPLLIEAARGQVITRQRLRQCLLSSTEKTENKKALLPPLNPGP